MRQSLSLGVLAGCFPFTLESGYTKERVDVGFWPARVPNLRTALRLFTHGRNPWRPRSPLLAAGLSGINFFNCRVIADSSTCAKGDASAPTISIKRSPKVIQGQFPCQAY